MTTLMEKKRRVASREKVVINKIKKVVKREEDVFTTNSVLKDIRCGMSI